MTDENMQGTDAEGVDWGGATAAVSEELAALGPYASGPAPHYPEYPPLAEAPVSINFKVTGEPMITVRGFDGSQITALLNDLTANGVWANIAAAQADLRVQGQFGSQMGPVTPVAPQGPPPGLPQGPPAPTPQPPGYGQGTPPPWAVTGPPQGAPSYQSGPPPQQQWQGGGGYGGGGQQKAQPSPQPPGWMRVNGRSGPGFDAWKQLRETQKDYLKGKIKWGGQADYWVEPSIAQWLAGQGFAVTP